MTIPDFQSLILPILKAAKGTETLFSKVIDSLADDFNLTEEERKERIADGTETVIYNRAHWAKSHLKKAGLVEYPKRGHYRITAKGIEVLETNPEKINLRFLRNLGKDDKSSEPDDDKDYEDLTAQEKIDSALKEIEEVLTKELLEKVIAEEFDFFEELIVKLLLEMGYGGSRKDAGKAIGKSGDDGVDGVIHQDVLGLDRIYIQAKRYGDGTKIGSKDVRDFSGALDFQQASKGVFVTTSEFTKDARKTAEKIAKNIVLIDGRELAELMIRHNIGCQIKETKYIKEIDEDFFDG